MVQDREHDMLLWIKASIFEEDKIYEHVSEMEAYKHQKNLIGFQIQHWLDEGQWTDNAPEI